MYKTLLVYLMVCSATLLIVAMFWFGTRNDWYEYNEKGYTQTEGPIDQKQPATNTVSTAVEVKEEEPAQEKIQEEVVEEVAQEEVIQEKDQQEPTKKIVEEVVIPERFTLDVPFTSQAPHENWDSVYQGASEEACVFMVGRFQQGQKIENAEDADRAILELVNFNESIGYEVDTTAEETANMLEQFYALETEVVYDFSWDDVKKAIVHAHPVIVPTAGRQLGNPYYTPPQPEYHMLVITGFTPDQVITNDPGTKHGFGFAYNYDTLYNAVHDFNGGDVENGKKVMIVVKGKK